jgi:multicomponent Na+:H+ antiporter subunit E
MRRRLPLAIWLVAVWLALWEDLSPANLAVGATLALLLLGAAPAIGPTRSPMLRPLATLRFLVVFAWKVVEANASVAWEVLKPRSRIREGIVAVRLRQSTDLLTTLVANAVTLTPGTLTLEVQRDEHGITLFVHVLQLHSPDLVRRDVLRFEELIVRAFGDQVAVAALSAAHAMAARKGHGGDTT